MYPTICVDEIQEIEEDLTIADVDEVIRQHHMENLSSPKMPSMTIPSAIPSSSNTLNITSDQNPLGLPFVRILEQPAQRSLRFRYECEGRSAGSIPGASSSSQTKTYPTIQVVNYQGAAAVVVSCVTKDGPAYKPHPHNLVGREGCKRGICTMTVNTVDMVCTFTSLGIQCVKKKDIDESLRQREALKVDPFKTGFSHRTQTSNIDLNVVRLCFQVFIEGPTKGKYTIPLQPVVSDPIFDKKALSELIITKMSHHAAPVCGDTEVILLCDRITKDDVQIYFYQEHQGQIIWQGYGDFQPSDVHKQFAISFKTPRYRDQNITQPVNVFVQMRRISDGTVSEPRPFQFTPLGDPEGLRHKRQKIDDGCLDRFLRDDIHGAYGGDTSLRTQRIIKQPLRTRIKNEPRDHMDPSLAQAMSSFPQSSHVMGIPMDIPGPSLALPGSPKMSFLPETMQCQGVAGDFSVQDIVSIATNQIGSIPETNGNASCMDPVQETADKFSGLDLGMFDSKELKEFGLMSETLNLSASIFDSGNLNNNNNLNTPSANLPSSSILGGGVSSDRTTGPSTEENLQQISKLHSEISVLNNLCGGNK